MNRLLSVLLLVLCLAVPTLSDQPQDAERLARARLSVTLRAGSPRQPVDGSRPEPFPGSRLTFIAVAQPVEFFSAAGRHIAEIPPETFTGKCTAVFDGDTVRILKAGRAVTVRIEGIDCPESGQDYSARARRFTSSLVYGKVVQVKEKEIDDYGRIVARISVAGQDVSLALVTAGLAWHYRYFSSDRALAEAEKEARAARRGLWSMPNPVAPWNYRRRKRRETTPSAAIPNATASIQRGQMEMTTSTPELAMKCKVSLKKTEEGYSVQSYKGSFNVRMSPELHQKAAVKSTLLVISLNQLVRRAVEKEVADL